MRNRGNQPKIADRLGELSQPTGGETHLPVAFPRVTIEPKQALIAAATLAVGVGFFAFHGGGDQPPDYAALPTVETSTPASEVVVSVVGAVGRPGLTTLAPGSRVADALAQAEPLPEANLLAVNQAQKLVDGPQITVPVTGAVAGTNVPADTAAGTGGVSINSATAQELTQLDGVGEKTAEAIVAYREQHGGFQSIDDLQEIKGIGPAKFEALKGQVTL